LLVDSLVDPTLLLLWAKDIFPDLWMPPHPQEKNRKWAPRSSLHFTS
jgi:hypothetical protein